MSTVSVSLMRLLLRREARAFLAKGFDRRLVLAVVRRLLFGRRAAVLAEHEAVAAAVAGIVRHLVVLVERPVGRVGIVLVLAHLALLAGFCGLTFALGAGSGRSAAMTSGSAG